MLNGTGDDVRPSERRLDRAFYGQIVGLGSAGRKDYFLSARPDQPGDLSPRLLNGIGRGHPKGVGLAGRIAEMGAEVRQHIRQDPRVNRRGRHVVHIDGDLHCSSLRR